MLLPKPPRGLRLSHQDSKNFSHKVEDLMNTVFPLMPWKKITLKKKRQKIHFFYIFTKISPPASQPGRWSSQWWGVGRGFCPTSSSSEVPIPQEAGEHGSRCQSARRAGAESSVEPEFGVPVVRGCHHLVGKAVLRAEGQLVRGLHTVVDLWERQRKQGCHHRSIRPGRGN